MLVRRAGLSSNPVSSTLKTIGMEGDEVPSHVGLLLGKLSPPIYGFC